MLNDNSFQPGPAVAPPSSAGRKTGSRWGIWACLGILVVLFACLVLAAGAGYYLYTSNPELPRISLNLGNVPTPAPELDASGQSIGPRTLNANDPALFTRPSNSFQHYTEYSMDGYDNNNAPITTSLIIELMQQDQPGWLSYTHQVKKTNGATVDETEGAVLEGKTYDAQDDGTCRISADSFASQRQLENGPAQQFSGSIIGSLERVETGVSLNGVLADRYELTRKNMAYGQSTITEWKSGSIYRARVGGHVLRVEYTIVAEPQAWGLNTGDQYSADKPAILTSRDDFTYFPKGTLKVKVPAACAAELPAN